MRIQCGILRSLGREHAYKTHTILELAGLGQNPSPTPESSLASGIDYIILRQWFSMRLLRSPQGQNYIHNNKVLFAFSLMFSQVSREFSRSCVTCEHSISLMADGIWVCVFRCLKLSVLISDTIISARTIHINKSSLGASVICESTKGILRPKCLRTAVPWCQTQQRGQSVACSYTQPREKARRGKQAFFSGREPSRETLGMTHTQSFPALLL